MRSKKNYFSLLLLFLILVFSAFLRFYRLDELLGFWYDQGRDALVIWDLIHHKKFFLIGPVTGIEGIFLGPFFYYLLTPFYWLGNGNPVFAAAGLSWLSIGTVFLIYFLAKEIYGKEVGLLAAFFYGFSYNQVIFSRWLANPNPLPFFTLLALICLYQFIRGKEKFLIPAFFLSGLSLQLEAASAIWFLPATIIVSIWQRKNFKTMKVLLVSILAFLVTLFPQMIFNFRHQGILAAAFKKFLITEESFELPAAGLFPLIKARFLLYYDVFLGKLFPSQDWLRTTALALFSATTLLFRKKIFNDGGKMLAIWLFAPIIGFFFYHGNFGYIWDYYFAGAVPAFIILFSAGLIFLWQKGLLLKVLVCLFLIAFLINNIHFLRNYLRTGMGITLRAQLWAISWIYKDAGSKDFNVDVYVPPQIYYSYSYLFRWYGTKTYGREPQTKLVKNLYTLYEPDGEHPQFLKAWLARQDTIGKIIKSDFWGDITVQKRERIKYE